ncbi:hypothetical protein WKH56_19885 [Priestia sp. SB1]|uniref:hypothetical protein n=1 Tax=Priestia sp. SB1 TaxID=3132359 RepID=UPI0031812514
MTNIRKILQRGMEVGLIDLGDFADITVDSKNKTHEVIRFRDEYVTVKSLSSGAITTFFDFDLHYIAPSIHSDYHPHTLKVRLTLLEISSRAFDEYRSTKNNEDISMEEACRKLTRNVILAQEKYTDPSDERYIGKKAYNYGYLFIVVKDINGKKVITFIKNDKKDNNTEQLDNDTNNNRTKQRKFSKDQRMYVQLNERLGIKDDHEVVVNVKPEVEVVYKAAPVKEEKDSLFKKFVKLFK